MRFYYYSRVKIVAMVNREEGVMFSSNSTIRFLTTPEAINKEFAVGLTECHPREWHEKVRQGFITALVSTYGPADLIHYLRSVQPVDSLPGVPHDFWPFVAY
ncbi:MAG TPA: hypothetical protein VFT59_02300 [Candidatus Saccharimonadales bacterium]|nr:hypothetical protein [Candidatus Saccharimonadales bacterium]